MDILHTPPCPRGQKGQKKPPPHTHKIFNQVQCNVILCLLYLICITDDLAHSRKLPKDGWANSNVPTLVNIGLTLGG